MAASLPRPPRPRGLTTSLLTCLTCSHSQADIVPLLLDQQDADRRGVPLTRRRLAVIVWNGWSHYDATWLSVEARADEAVDMDVCE